MTRPKPSGYASGAAAKAERVEFIRGVKKLSTQRTSVYTGQVVNLGIETVLFPDGRSLALEVVRHPGGAAAAAVDAAGRVCLVRQYRHAAGGWIWEVPAGKLEESEEPLAAARRELEEEAGVRARSWQDLGSILPTPGFCDEIVHLYLARDLELVPPRRQPNELIEVHWIPFSEALSKARSGGIRDAKTVAALFRASGILEEP